MKKLYSIVLMAAALLVGTNAWAGPVSTWDGLKTALQAGEEVTLSADINVTADNVATWCGIWIGSESVDGTAPTAVLDLNGHNIIINSGNYQSKGVTKEQALNPFAITKGSLTIKSDSPAKIQVVKGQSIVSKSTNVFSVFGANEANKKDPKGNDPFTYLEIGENVTVETQNGTVVAIDRLTVGHAAVGTNTNNYATDGYAYGARIEIKGSLISQGAESTTISGTPKSYQNKCYGIKVNGLVLSPADENKKYAPYVHIHPSAVLQSDNRSGEVNGYPIMAGSAAVYASGFAQWLIEGNCSGATGVYIGSGILVINDALVKSAADVYDAAGAGGHANGSGSAIVINSRSNYPGEVAVTVTGDTKAESTSGYALEEIVNTTNNETKVENINIQGGTFEGGAQGALVVTPTTATEATVNVTGGNVEGTGNIGTEGLADYLNNQGGTHTTLIEDESGKTILVISAGAAPDAGDPVTGNMVSNQSANASVKWTVNTKDTIKTNLKLAELEINTDGLAQELVIKENATLEVGRVVLGKDAKIIVEPGAKLIVTGNQGIVAPVATNIVMRNEDGKRSILLFNPAVTSNKHPNATVELITNSWAVSASDLQWEILGLPTNEIVTSIDREGTAPVAISVWENGSWSSLGIIGQDVIDVTKLNKPFAPYDLLANRAKDAAAPKIIIKGQLVGNIAGSLNATHRWTPFANSYTGELDLKAYLTALGAAQNIAQGIWVATRSGNGHLAWDPVDLQGVFDGDAEVLKLAPMQAFMLNNPGTSIEASALDYGSMVWAPATSTPNPAPRRMAASETTAKARVIVTNEQGIVDKVMLRENANNVYALEKYLNEDMNIYVLADEKSAIVNAENMENMYVGFSTVNGGKFTINFANVAGREFVLVDHETGAQVAMVEGATYEFTAAANSTNDYRFEIVSPRKVTTAIENAEAVKNAKGIYTITGQYMGEMNVWNSLPAGVYVVNGEKRVK